MQVRESMLESLMCVTLFARASGRHGDDGGGEGGNDEGEEGEATLPRGTRSSFQSGGKIG